MVTFYDREMATRLATSDQAAGYENFARQWKARLNESRQTRTPRLWVTLGGGHEVGGQTVALASEASVTQGFEMDSFDRTLAYASANVTIPFEAVTEKPKPGQSIQIALGVDPTNRVSAFLGQIEDVRVSGSRKAYELSCFDAIRRMLDIPFREPSSASDVVSTYATDTTETDLPASVQIQISELLSAASVLTHSLSGIEQYPTVETRKNTLYEELSALLRAANCRAYLSPTGRLLVTYTDEAPLWAVALMGDLGNPSRQFLTPTASLFTRFHLPLLQVRAVYPDRIVSQRTDAGAASVYPNQRISSEGNRLTLQQQVLDADNAIRAERVEDSEILNEVRSRTTPEDDTRDFIDLSAMTFEDLETLSFSQIGDASTSVATSLESVAEYGLRWRTYDLGGLAETPRATVTPTDTGQLGPPSVNYGRFAMHRADFSESQMRARRFPAERIRLVVVGMVSVQPFEVVVVNLPEEGFQGHYQIEGARHVIGSGGFVSHLTLRKLGVHSDIVDLDARD